jgi:hypothetical protein
MACQYAVDLIYYVISSYVIYCRCLTVEATMSRHCWKVSKM